MQILLAKQRRGSYAEAAGRKTLSNSPEKKAGVITEIPELQD